MNGAGVSACALRKAGPADRFLDGSLQHGFMQVVSAALPCDRVEVCPRGRKEPLPADLPAGARILSAKRVGQLDPARTGANVQFMDPLRVGDSCGDGFDEPVWKHRDPVLPSLTVVYTDLALLEIDVR